MKANCPSCGAINDLPIDESVGVCSYCGTQIQRNILKESKKGNKLLKAEISSDDELKFKNRNIDDISEIIDMYTDAEIENVFHLTLPDNNLKSLKGISRFTLRSLKLCNNNLTIIDDFPNLESLNRWHPIDGEGATNGIDIDLSNNVELTDISDDVINKINNFKNLSNTSRLALIGCRKFNFEALSKIKYVKIFSYYYEEKKRSMFYNENTFEIFVDNDLELPFSLKQLGFISEPDSLIGFGSYKNSDIKANCWKFRKVYDFEVVSLKRANLWGTYDAPKDNILLIAEEYKKTNSKTAAVSKAMEIFDTNEANAKELVEDILGTNSLFPRKESSISSCFIATASLGDYNHPTVLELRQFRDNWLLKRNWGKKFTNWYYQHGPKAAKVIEKSKLLRLASFYFIVKPLQLLTRKLM